MVTSDEDLIGLLSIWDKCWGMLSAFGAGSATGTFLLVVWVF
jgi:hypothetical protein